jgi:hypothetical protein
MGQQELGGKNIPPVPLAANKNRHKSGNLFEVDLETQAQAYSWEHLAPDRKREVMHMVNRASGRRRVRLVALLVVLVLILGMLAAAYFMMPSLNL